MVLVYTRFQLIKGLINYRNRISEFLRNKSLCQPEFVSHVSIHCSFNVSVDFSDIFFKKSSFPALFHVLESIFHL